MSIKRARKGGHAYERGVEPIFDWMDREYQYGKFKGQGAPAAKTTDATLTAAELLGGMITCNRGGSAAGSYQLPAGSAIETAFKSAMGHDLENGDSFDFSVINISVTAAETASLTTNTNLTLVGRMMMDAVAAGNASSGRFRVRRTAADTYSVYRVA